MCTIVALHGLHPELGLVVAANRDEYYARATASPHVVRESPRVVAGVDLERGGTWMGANEHGLFVAITNQRTFGGTDPTRASRGRVVMDALACRDVDEVEALARALDAREYNAFNLMWGDARALRVAYARTERAAIEIEALPPGLHVLANDRIGSPEFPKAARATALVAPLVREPWPVLSAGLAHMLADHEKTPIDEVMMPPEGVRFDRAMIRELSAICIHTPIYGTRSAMILALAPGRVVHGLVADGPPCTTPFLDVSALFEA